MALLIFMTEYQPVFKINSWAELRFANLQPWVNTSVYKFDDEKVSLVSY